MSINPWTDAERQILHDLYAVVSIQTLETLLPDRTRSAIYTQAFLLGLTKAQVTGIADILAQRRRLEAQKERQQKEAERKAQKAEQAANQNPKQIKKRPIPFAPWERQILTDLGPRCTFAELRMVMPRRSIADLRTMARQIDIELFEDKNPGDRNPGHYTQTPDNDAWPGLLASELQ